MTPKNVPPTFALPPLIAVPPMTTAAIASISMPSPAVGCALPARPVRTSAATAQHTPISAYTPLVTQKVLMPETRAVSGLPPMATAQRPKIVLFRMIKTTSITNSMIKIATGISLNT